MQSASMTLSLADYTQLQASVAEARQEAVALRAELEEARKADPLDRVEKLTTFARDCLTIARFGVANLPPEMIKSWPYKTLRQVCENITALPDCSINDRDMAIDLLAFAKDCESHELRRQGV